MSKIYSLDTETGPYPMEPGDVGAWALEPYREEFYTKMMGVAGPNDYGKCIHMSGDNFTLDIFSELEWHAVEEHLVYCHNAIFDISVLIRTLTNVDTTVLSKIKWRDTSLLAKWLNNSQKDEHFRYSLRNCVEKWLPDSDRKTEFLSIKDNIEDDYEYWTKRVIEDCHMTRELAIELESMLPDSMSAGYVTECACLYPLARGYMQGIMLNTEVIDVLKLTYQSAVNKGCRELGVTEATLRSPKKLGQLLFCDWELEPYSQTPSGSPSTAAKDLKHVALESGDERIIKLLDIKSKLTVISKYANGFNNATNYLNEKAMHPVPRLFNGYTGRMSYNSKLFKKFQVGIALHQLPRKDKDVKRAMIAPLGYQFLYMDFAAQELRIMAQFSHDVKMIEAFNNGRDLHSVMTESIYGVPYDEVVAGNKHSDPDIVDKRNCGKLTNLSSMYRIGAKSLQNKFFEQYDKEINMRQAQNFLNVYKRTFKGIPRYWTSAVDFARANKGAVTLSGRKFGIASFDWKGESSAINFPIQGSGADLSELAIAVISREFPDLIFQIQVHDSLTWLIPDHYNVQDVVDKIAAIRYNDYFKADLKLEFPMDFAIGPNLADLTTVEVTE